MTLSRRQFCSTVGAVTMGVAALPRQLLAKDPPAFALRVIAYNVYVCHGWPDDRAKAKAAVASGAIVEQTAEALAKYQPDIINFSESPSEAIALQIAKRLGMNHVRFPSGGKWPGTILSRFPIIDSQNTPLGAERPADLFTRHWGRATLQLPDGDTLIVHSAHLYPNSDPPHRVQEVKAMLDSMRADMNAGRSMLLIGDLNHEPEEVEYKLWTEAGWVDTFAKVGQGAGYTIKADTPLRRIDYVMAFGPLAQQIRESRPLFEGPFRVDLNDPESYALSDHLPQLAVFGSRENH